jgi:secondary thiamine-phosphate synthase enzyme
MYYTIDIRTQRRIEVVDITSQVSELIRRAKIVSGLAVLYSPHTTCGIMINENYDPTVKEDIMNALSRYFPHNYHYAHTEGNADAHIKTALVGTSQAVIIENGELVLGTWQGIFLCEFDGPRTRKVYLKIIKE